MDCECILCLCRELSLKLGRTVHPWEIHYGLDDPAAEEIRRNPGQPIYYYDKFSTRYKQMTGEIASAHSQKPRPPIILVMPDRTQIEFTTSEEVSRYLDSKDRNP